MSFELVDNCAGVQIKDIDYGFLRASDCVVVAVMTQMSYSEDSDSVYGVDPP